MSLFPWCVNTQMDGVKKRELILPNLLRFATEHDMCLLLVTHDVSCRCPLSIGGDWVSVTDT